MNFYSSYAYAEKARAHVKCFANLTQHLFTMEMRSENKNLEKMRQQHLELAIKEGRKEYSHQKNPSVDFFLGGYVERVFRNQMAKLNCDNPNNYLEYCSNWISQDVKVLSKIGMKFYERENCKFLLK